MTLRVTLDTNVLARHLVRLQEAAAELDVEMAYTTVTLRENARDAGQDEIVLAETGVYDESHYDSGAVYASPPVFESVVFDESRFGYAAFGGIQSQSILDSILALIASGSFPKRGERDELTKTQRAQLRDAMILEAHTREGRDVLVSNDVKAFIGKTGERRMLLEAVCRTRILTIDEFLDYLAELRVTLRPF
jgi:hypothetical protein